MKPVEVLNLWIERFNAGDVDGLMDLYADDAVNHQVVTDPLVGKDRIRKLFETEFARAEMVCIPEMIHDAGDWVILEWKDPKGLRGCGFFNIVAGKIRMQRGYFDRLSFFEQQGICIPDDYLEG